MTRLRRTASDLRTADDGAAMVMTVVFMIFAGGLMLALLATLLAQAEPLQSAQKSTRAGYAAQAGIQTGLSVIRSNTMTVSEGATTTIYGDPSKLPTTLAGSVDGEADSALTYDVVVDYYYTNPTGKSDAWLLANAKHHPLAKQPTHARIVSTGSDGGTGERTIAAVYAFTTTNVNIPGGLIFNADGSRCLKADTATIGSYIRLVSRADCTDDDLDLWVYDTDYRLKLAITVNSGTELCITGRNWTSSANPVNATLRKCAATNSAATGNQLWSWEGFGAWISQNQANTARGNRYLGTSGGNYLIESSTTSGKFEPTAAVGAGAASYETHQIVNYEEFGRCMDVTEEVITKNFMIVYPCKQDPTGTGALLLWNHKWYYTKPVSPVVTSAPQSVSVKTASNVNYCLTTSTSTTDVRFTACVPGSPNASQKFIRNENTPDPLTSYTFQLASDTSKCLTAVPEPLYAWSHIRVQQCDGDMDQKWNAPPTLSPSTLGDYKEIG